MQTILDEPLATNDGTNVKYAGFWPRLGATIVDAIILMPVVFAITYLNINSWRSAVVQIAVSLASIVYKPLMEYLYGATVGKMAVKIKVTDLNYEKADLGKILLRNIFGIVPAIVSLVLMIGNARGGEFDPTASYQIEAFGRSLNADLVLTAFSMMITIADGLVLVLDDRKRSLHDKIAGTFVIEK